MTRLPGFASAARLLTSRRFVILSYHGVVERPLRPSNVCHLPASIFEEQIRYVAQHYTPMHLDELLDRLDRGDEVPPRTACVTFDDGFRTVSTTAFPILSRYRVPATVFLVTSTLDTRQPAWPDRLFHGFSLTTRSAISFDGVQYDLDDERARASACRAVCGALKAMPQHACDASVEALAQQLGVGPVPPESPFATLDWDEVRGLAETGLIRFGSHTHSHPILSRCTPAVQRRELEMSRDILRARGLSAQLFAYPNGEPDDFTAETRRLLGELGYRCGLTTIHGLNGRDEDTFGLRRVHVDAGTVGTRFAALLTGFSD